MNVSLLVIMAGIYLHIPFCKQACHYCDFHFSTSTEIKNGLVECMTKEIILQKNYLASEPIDTIYFGGGTPSLLTSAEVDQLLKTIYSYHPVNERAEITLEANPDDITFDTLTAFNNVGINRLSIGVQSFHDYVLRFLNRAHDGAAAATSITLAREAGFDNINVDLIYAIPGQTEADWRSNILEALKFSPEHISAYCLTIEQKTAFGRWSAIGKLKVVEDDVAAKQLEILVEALETAGYEQYEISNFSKVGFNSKHNSSYWKDQKYLGIGPSAHSYNLITRQYNVHNNYTYIKAIGKSTVPFEIEILSFEDRVNEYLLTTLRTHWGCNLHRLKEIFNYDVLTVHRVLIMNLLERELAVVENNFLKLTKKGMLLADKISSDLFLVS
jgi:oxygen-independent coproporphyrinogen-3 oxidase